MTEMQTGDRVTWLYEPRGGYGYVIPVDGTVIRIGPRRIMIAVSKCNGDRVERWVQPDRLRER